MAPVNNLLRILVPAMVVGALQANEPAWNPVPTPSGAHFTLQYRIYAADTNWLLEFRNTGSQPVHFHFRFPGLQSKQEAIANGRIHLPALKGKAQLPILAIAGHAPQDLVHRPLKVFNVRSDVTDRSEAEPEQD